LPLMSKATLGSVLNRGILRRRKAL